MAKKTYRTYYLKGLDIHLRDKDGNRLIVTFRGGIQVDSTAKFTTSDPHVQEQLEKSSGFNRDYYLESSKETVAVEPVKQDAPAETAKAEKEKQPLTDVKDSRRFKNLVEMKDAMAEVGIAVTPGMNYMQAKTAAQKEGYDFQIQK